MVLIGLADCIIHIHRLHLGSYQSTFMCNFSAKGIKLNSLWEILKISLVKVTKNTEVNRSEFKSNLGPFQLYWQNRKNETRLKKNKEQLQRSVGELHEYGLLVWIS